MHRPAQALATARLTIVAIASVTVVVVLRPDMAALRGAASHPRAWVDSVGTDRAAAVAAGFALWLLAVVLCVGIASAFVATAPGALGAVAEGVSRLLLPAVLRRTIATAAGVGVMLAPVAAGAQDIGGARAQQYTPSATSATAPPPPSAAIPAPAWPTRPSQSPSGPRRPARPADRPRASRPAGAATVVVAPGDSLWLIASRRLGPTASDAAICAEWHRWYAANRAAVGTDPDVIHPGLSLDAPQFPSHSAHPKESS